MKPFIHEDFLLETGPARVLYHECAKRQPILDFHCHLPPDQIAGDKKFEDLTELWLAGDHYKWRAMRTNGVAEQYITGNASSWEKFSAWAGTVPDTLRNPLYHWTHLELAFPFGIRDRLLGPDTARAIFDECNQKLSDDSFSARGLLALHGVKAVCSTDDPTDTLAAHASYRTEWQANPSLPRMFPTWRPDRAFAVDDVEGFNSWIDELERVSNTSIGDFSAFLEALHRRHEHFHRLGCRLSDHGLETLYTGACRQTEASALFDQLRNHRELTPLERDRYRSFLLHELALWDHERGWVQQFHLGALRNNNTRLLRKLGPDTGFDSIGDEKMAKRLVSFLDALDQKGRLAKTILYNLNPAENEVFASMIGNYQDGSVPGKMQHGSAWWFLDQLDGMEKQMNALSNLGLLARFVGMLTDSRCFLSYSRHDYFRRLLCNLLGNEVARGLLPDDQDLLMSLVRNVCFDNARRYFDLDLADDARSGPPPEA